MVKEPPLGSDNGTFTADSTFSDRTHEDRASIACRAEEGLAIGGADDRAGRSLVVFRSLRMGRATLVTTLMASVRFAVRFAMRAVVRGTTMRGNWVRSTVWRTTVRADIFVDARVLAVRGRGSAEHSGVLPTRVGVRAGGAQD